MNIHDVDKVELPKTCWLTAIFKRQHELREKYIEIEIKNGFRAEKIWPVNLHDRFAQHELKDFAWRFTEELGEAHECLQDHKNDSMWYKIDDIYHYREELIDAFHFLTEFTLLVGLNPNDIVPLIMEPDELNPSARLNTLLCQVKGMATTPRELYEMGFHVVVQMGLVCNYLKNKPWKQSHMMTDEARMKRKLVGTWGAFFMLLRRAGFTSRDVYETYFKKSEVNKFRQRSKY